MEATINPAPSEKETVEQLGAARERILAELRKAIVGQDEVIEQILLALMAGGHCLITGAPGLAKTLLVKSIADIFHLHFQRIQFTPDLMPADIIGVEILQENDGDRRLEFVKGPVFSNILLADEINRTPPKTQAALLENPIEMEGTYPLPEAQLDRFMFNVVIDYLPEGDEVAVVLQTTGGKPRPIEPIFSGEDVQRFHEVVRSVPIAEDVVRYAVRIAAASRPNQSATPEFVNNWVSWGAGTRAAQYLVLGAKARAVLNGRAFATPDDVRALAYPVLRHRILVNYRAEAEGVTVETVITRLLEHVQAN
jgi:MoxR-like ATPase